MPTPNKPGVIRVQSVFQGGSGLPEDRYVTTLHFQTPTMDQEAGTGSADELHLQAALQKVEDFWMTAPGTHTIRPVDLMGRQILHGPSGINLRAYHLGDPEPRQPTERDVSLTSTWPTTALPAEVAICCSFSANPPLPRQRGRIYIGPLNPNVIASGGNGEDARVDGGKRLMLVDALAAMAAGDPMDPALWCVYSPTTNTAHRVVQGYVDDAFDTQRRRGAKPVSRTGFTI